MPVFGNSFPFWAASCKARVSAMRQNICPCLILQSSSFWLLGSLLASRSAMVCASLFPVAASKLRGRGAISD
jgi:hypothetical protein